MFKSIDDDSILVEGLKRGDEAAFRKIFEKYKDKLFTYCCRVTKSEELAEEIVHDVLVKVWLQRGQLNHSLSFKSFLYTITHNASLNFLRKIAANESVKRKASLYLEKFRNVTENTVYESDFEKIKNEAINALPTQRRIIFEMSRNQHMTHDEIATTLGISKHTVRNQIIEALKFIKQYLKVHADISYSLAFIAFLVF